MTEFKDGISVIDLTRITAKNMYEMLMELALHIEKIQEENASLKRQLGMNTDETK